ncbi:MAG: hypothetical protein HN742_22750 [Lentisphaerae bacterium]|jgi:hypothetical protein|nr:hypothetical protein [Lentisphaerota bacterium]MBT5612510.1 hypothetical protein [Lentisphaerota bacterium]MBT7844715.1 hypothetical protein [Lentisphaerota bacterium]
MITGINAPFRTILTAALTSLTATAGGKEMTRDIGSRRELFVDHHLIDTLTNARLELNRPRNEGVVIRFDEPWEYPFAGCPTIIKDDDVYRLIYRGMHATGDGTNVECTCYAESADGHHWQKPDLGLFEIKGTRKNNVILADDPPFSHNFSPFLDDRPGVASEARFKAVAGVGKSKGLWAFTSPDAVHWHKLGNGPIITRGAFDSHNVAFWSEHEQAYLCYFRTFQNGKRWVSRTTSDDFVNWAEPVAMTFAHRGQPAPQEHIYTNGTHPYFRAPHLYIALPFRFMPGRRALTSADARRIGLHPSYANDCSDAVLMTSRGGNVFERTFLESFVRPDMGPENWVSRTNMPALNVVQTSETEMSLYLECNYAQPTVCLRRYSLRLDGFASVRAGYDGGEMLTKPLTFGGERLTVNFATSAAGSLRVEIQDAQGIPIPGYTLDEAVEQVGNTIERAVSWTAGSDVSGLEGKPVRLRFVLKDADLYALRFGPAPPPEKLREGLYTFDADSPPLRETTLIVPGGNEDVTYRGNAKLVVDGRQSAVGSGAVVLEAAGSGLTTVELPRTRNLGSSFTLAAFITFRDARWTRLFSNYSGSGKPALDELALSFDPSGKTAPGLVYTAKSVQVHSGPVELKTGRYYHVAVTHADGAVRLYVDGEEVATGEVPSGPVLLASNLGVGEDIGGPANEQLRGCIDEILVLGQALSASKIRALSERRKPCPPQVPAAPSPDRGHD